MAYYRKYKTSKGEVRWKAEIKIKGAKPISKSLPRLTDLKEWVRKKEEHLKRVASGLEHIEEHTLAEALERYQEDYLPKLADQATNLGFLKWWEGRLGPYMLNNITAHEIIRQRKVLENEPLDKNGALRKPRTVQGYVNFISHVFTLAVDEWGWMPLNPAKNIKKLKFDNARTRFLSNAEHTWAGEKEPRQWDSLTKSQKSEARVKYPRAYELPRLKEALINQAKQGNPYGHNAEWAYKLFIIQLSAGLRLAEATHLVWEENDVIQHPIVIVDMANKVLLLKSTKHDTKPRKKPICGEMLTVLSELYAERRYDTPLVFPSRSNLSKPLDFRRRISRAIREAGLQDFRWHDLRHTTASYMSMMGASQREIMEVLHHNTLQSSQRYTHLSENHIQSLFGKFSKNVLEG